MSIDLETAFPRLLVIEDDEDVRKFLRAALLNSGYRLVEAATGEKGLTSAAEQPPALVLLDLGLPDMDGLTVIRQLRCWSQVPIIVLSARSAESDKIRALDEGANDYLTKPFGVGELLARIRAALRQAPEAAAESAPPEFVLGDLRINYQQRRVLVCDAEVHLTPIEYRILTSLARQPGRLVTHRQLLKEVWGPGHDFDRGYLRVYMTHLRRKIERTPTQPEYLITDPGVGYRLGS